MTPDLREKGDSEPRLSFGRGVDIPMLTVGQLRAIVADPALLDEHLVVVYVGDVEGSYRHIEAWNKPSEYEGFSAFTLHPGEPLDSRDF